MFDAKRKLADEVCIWFLLYATGLTMDPKSWILLAEAHMKKKSLTKIVIFAPKGSPFKRADFYTTTSEEYDFCEYELNLIRGGLSKPESATEKYQILSRH